MKYIYKKLVKWIFAILVFDLQLSSLLAFFRQNGNGGKPVHDGGDCHQPVITNGIKFFEERKKKEGKGASKKDVNNYLRKQAKEAKEPINNAFAEAFSKIQL